MATLRLAKKLTIGILAIGILAAAGSSAFAQYYSMQPNYMGGWNISGGGHYTTVTPNYMGGYNIWRR